VHQIIKSTKFFINYWKIVLNCVHIFFYTAIVFKTKTGYNQISNMTCFECGEEATELHHVVPKSLGGTKTVPLCAKCHGLIHGVTRLNVSTLTKAALQKRKDMGVVLGRKRDISSELVKYIWELRAHKLSYHKIAEILEKEGVKTARGGYWHASTIKMLCDRLDSSK